MRFIMIEMQRSLTITHSTLFTGLRQVSLFVHERDNFLLSTPEQQIRLGKGQILVYNIFQEALDHTEVKEDTGCADEEDRKSAKISEDSCLANCLAEKFTAEFGCVHARIRPMLAEDSPYYKNATCDDRHIQRVLKERGVTDTIGVSLAKNIHFCEHRMKCLLQEEIGLRAIRETLDGFRSRKKVAENRCGCRFPCESRIFRTQQVAKFDFKEDESITFKVHSTFR